MKKVLKIVAHEWGSASRDRKELAICSELGCEVFVMQKGGTKDKGRHEVIHGFDVYDYSTRPLGDARLLTPLNRVVSLFTWAHYARKFKPDIITGHDYIALLIGWMSTTFIPKKKRPKLVYDSHEFELGRNKKRSKLALWFVKRIEGFLLKRCEFAIVVSRTIGELLVSIYGCKTPIVARNIPLYWHIDKDIISQRHEELCSCLNIGNDEFFIMFHGGIMKNRGIEQLIRIGREYDIPLVLLGNPVDSAYYKTIINYAKKNGSSKILFKPAVPLEDLWQYVGAANVGIITIPPLYESYYHMLPNKLFENIQSLTPVITSNFPDISEIVTGYDIGLTVNPEDAKEIASAILRMRDDKDLYSHFKENLVRAKEELCWEHEKEQLYEAYRKLINV